MKHLLGLLALLFFALPAWSQAPRPPTPTGAASAIKYDNTTSGLSSTDVQAAVDELSLLTGGGSAAPGDVQYLTLAIDGGLSQERVLAITTASTFLTTVDGGADGNYTVDVDFAGMAQQGSPTTGDWLVIERSGTFYKVDWNDLPGAVTSVSSLDAGETDELNDVKYDTTANAWYIDQDGDVGGGYEVNDPVLAHNTTNLSGDVVSPILVIDADGDGQIMDDLQAAIDAETSGGAAFQLPCGNFQPQANGSTLPVVVDDPGIEIRGCSGGVDTAERLQTRIRFNPSGAIAETFFVFTEQADGFVLRDMVLKHDDAQAGSIGVQVGGDSVSPAPDGTWSDLGDWVIDNVHIQGDPEGATYGENCADDQDGPGGTDVGLNCLGTGILLDSAPSGTIKDSKIQGFVRGIHARRVNGTSGSRANAVLYTRNIIKQNHVGYYCDDDPAGEGASRGATFVGNTIEGNNIGVHLDGSCIGQVFVGNWMENTSGETCDDAGSGSCEDDPPTNQCMQAKFSGGADSLWQGNNWTACNPCNSITDASSNTDKTCGHRIFADSTATGTHRILGGGRANGTNDLDNGDFFIAHADTNNYVNDETWGGWELAAAATLTGAGAGIVSDDCSAENSSYGNLCAQGDGTKWVCRDTTDYLCTSEWWVEQDATLNVARDTDGDGNPDWITVTPYYDGLANGDMVLDLQAAHDALTDTGNKTMIIQGNYTPSSDDAGGASGTGFFEVSGPIHVRCEGAKLTGDLMDSAGDPWRDVIWGDGSTGRIEIEGCHIDGANSSLIDTGTLCGGNCCSGSACNRMGIHIAGGSRHSIHDNFVEHTLHSAIYIENATHARITSNHVEESAGWWDENFSNAAVYQYCDTAGVIVQDPVIEGNTILRSSQAIQLRAGTHGCFIRGGLIANNVVRDAQSLCARTGGTDGATIRNNEFFDCSGVTSHQSATGWLLEQSCEGSGATCSSGTCNGGTDNTKQTCTADAYLGDRNLTIANNTFYQTINSVLLYDYVDGATIQGNTFYETRGVVVQANAPARDIVIADNKSRSSWNAGSAFQIVGDFGSEPRETVEFSNNTIEEAGFCESNQISLNVASDTSGGISIDGTRCSGTSVDCIRITGSSPGIAITNTYADMIEPRFMGYMNEATADGIICAQSENQADADIVGWDFVGDTALAMAADEYIGYLVEIVGGTGSGQIERIRSNTTTTLYITGAWTTEPDTTSDFIVYETGMDGRWVRVSNSSGSSDCDFTGTTGTTVNACYCDIDSGASAGDDAWVDMDTAACANTRDVIALPGANDDYRSATIRGVHGENGGYGVDVSSTADVDNMVIEDVNVDRTRGYCDGGGFGACRETADCGGPTCNAMNTREVLGAIDLNARTEASCRQGANVTDATSATTTTIVDTGESWTVDEFVGYWVEIDGGTNAEQRARVLTNTATQITVASWPGGTPDTTSDFTVYNCDVECGPEVSGSCVD